MHDKHTTALVARKALRHYRKINNIPDQEMELALSYSMGTIYRFESGTNIFPAGALIDLLAFFELSLEEFLYYSERGAECK